MQSAIRGALVVLITLLFAPSALAASVSRTGDVVTVTGTSSAERIYVTFEGSPVGAREVAVSEDTVMTPGTNCEQGYPGSANPQYAHCGLGVTKVIVNAGEGDDLVFSGFNLTTQIMEFNGEGGRDDLRGGPANDVISGGPGNDSQLLGDAGNDIINGGEGDDVRLLGDSDITPVDKLGADTINGGPGNNTLDEQRNDTGDRPKFWSLDGLPNNGTDRDDNRANGAEEGDNAMPDIENVHGSYDDDIIVGNASNNKLHGGSVGNDVLIGLEGDDDLFTGVTGEGDSADGGPGNNKVQGNHELKGGPGVDEMTGQGSNDQIDGGPGPDSISAGGGNDTVQAVDGEVDQIGCGSGGDITNADFNDVISTDPGQICENVTRTTPPAPPPPPPAPPGPVFNPFGAPAGLRGASGAVVPAVQAAKTGAVSGSFANIYNRATATTTVTGNSADVAVAKIVVVGKLTQRNLRRGRVKFKVRLTAKAKRALAKRLRTRRSVRLRLAIKVTPPRASGGRVVTLRKSVTLRR